eukprot:3183786-Pyramimonas_sp.AAC.1
MVARSAASAAASSWRAAATSGCLSSWMPRKALSARLHLATAWASAELAALVLPPPSMGSSPRPGSRAEEGRPERGRGLDRGRCLARAPASA